MIHANLISDLRQALQSELPGDEAHLLVVPMNRLIERKKLASENYRKSAVSIVLHPTQNSLRCILIQRPDYDGNHGGQISFPGGKMDDSDSDLKHTAIRECMEEIQLPLTSKNYLGKLTQVYIPVSKFMVQPYIFYVDPIPNLIPDKREVESIFDFDILKLKDAETLKRTDIRIHSSLKMKDVPYFHLENKVVWGATAMMLAELKILLDRIY